MSTTALVTRSIRNPRPALHLVEGVPAAGSRSATSPGLDSATVSRTLPHGSAPRGFALYVGIDEAKAAASGVTLGVLVEALRRTVADLAPTAQTYATVALAAVGAGGRDVDVVRLALHEPTATARTEDPRPQDRAGYGVVVDISRKRVLIDGESAALTFKEFELLQYLVLREGATIERGELVSSLWHSASEDDAPGARTIDVHVRRLRAKLGRYEDIVRTVRGVGYRFDRHADVAVRFSYGAGPSPDRF